jgi:transcriptional regulator with XRE-family HTH domain
MDPMGMRISGRQILATNMRELRSARGWSQEDLAETCELHRTYIGAIERCERNVSIDNIDRIARAFGLAIGDLLTPQPKR